MSRCIYGLNGEGGRDEIFWFFSKKKREIIGNKLILIAFNFNFSNVNFCYIKGPLK